MIRKAARRIVVLVVVLSGSPACAAPGPSGDDPAERRRAMVERLRDRGIDDERVLAALERVPRHAFVPAPFRDRAYRDGSLPIGRGQTVSAPYVVALMSEEARIDSGDRVLEVGTGSGYHAAVLAELADEVYTVEIVESLARAAEERLGDLGYANVTVRRGDGYRGWPEEAPFDAVVVTAAPEEVPPALVEQLAAGGRLVLPVGARGGVQRLTVVEKAPDGTTTRRETTPVRFVPMVREAPEGAE